MTAETAADYADKRIGDHVLVLAEILPIGSLPDVGDHLKVRVKGGGRVLCPIARSIWNYAGV